MLGCGIRLHAGRICRIFAIFVPTAEWAHIFANVVAALLVCVDFFKKSIIGAMTKAHEGPRALGARGCGHVH